MSHRIQAFVKLNPQDKLTFLAALALLPLVGVSLRVFGVDRVRRMLGKEHPAGPESRSHIDRAERVAWLIQKASEHGLYGGTCMPRSFVLHYWLLRRQGIPTTLEIGVRRHEARLEAHAWVTCDGTLIGDTPEHVHSFQVLRKLKEA